MSSPVYIPTVTHHDLAVRIVMLLDPHGTSQRLDPVNDVKIALGEIGNIWPDRIKRLKEK